MGFGTRVYTKFLFNVLTVYYSIRMLAFFVYKFVKNPFRNPWAQKLIIEPPPQLTDPKYGVHKYIKANNIKLHYVESGDQSKPLMLFLHGFPEFWYTWRYQIVEFNKNYWCVAVDLRGYGDSEKPEEVSAYEISELVEDVRDLIRQLGRDKCILISHDWGGIIANKVRNEYPEVVSALIMLASTSTEAYSHELWNNSAQRDMAWYVFVFRIPVIPERFMIMNDLGLFDETIAISGKAIVDEKDLECYKYWLRKPYALTPLINYYRANISYTNLPNKYYEENVPMLVVHAAKDLYLVPNLLETIKKQYAYIETTVIEDVSHFLQQEEPVKVNKCIRDFLVKHNV